MNNSRSLYVVGLFCFAMALATVTRGFRAWMISVEHFDEGVYASNLFIGPPDFHYPFQQLYAPPLFPAMLEWLLILSGALPFIVMACNIVLGIVLVFAVAWTADQLLRDDNATAANAPLFTGPSMSAVAAMMFALSSEILVQYSRAALTDTPAVLWLTLAVGAGARSLKWNDWRWVIAAGVLTALAWWTKYNGWLPQAIIGAGIAGWFVFETRDVKSAQSAVLKWLMMAVIAGVLWLHCLSSLQASGGYAAVAANHAGYVVGPAGWLSSLQRHLEVDHFYSRYLTSLGPLLAVCMAYHCPVLTTRGTELNWTIRGALIAFVVGLALAVLTFFAGLLPTLAVLNVVAAVLAIGNKKNSGQASSIGRWILLAWILGLLLATPMYRPYPRLILPLLVGLIIGAGYGIERLLQRINGARAADMVDPPFAWYVGLTMWCGITVGVFSLVLPRENDLPAFAPRSQFRDLATAVEASIRQDVESSSPASNPDVDALIAVYGEPGLFFHLAKPQSRGSGFSRVVQPIGTIAPLRVAPSSGEVPTYLVTGPHARDAAKELEGMPDQVRQVVSLDYTPSPLVSLDDFSPAEMLQRPPEKIQVWTRRR